MKTIKIKPWKTKNVEGGEIDEDIVNILTALLSFKDPKTLPTGFKQVLMFGRIIKAFENKDELILEEEDYDFLKKIVEKDTPAFWGGNPNIVKALEEFNNAK